MTASLSSSTASLCLSPHVSFRPLRYLNLVLCVFCCGILPLQTMSLCGAFLSSMFPQPLARLLALPLAVVHYPHLPSSSFSFLLLSANPQRMSERSGGHTGREHTVRERCSGTVHCTGSAVLLFLTCAVSCNLCRRLVLSTSHATTNNCGLQDASSPVSRCVLCSVCVCGFLCILEGESFSHPTIHDSAHAVTHALSVIYSLTHSLTHCDCECLASLCYPV